MEYTIPHATVLPTLVREFRAECRGDTPNDFVHGRRGGRLDPAAGTEWYDEADPVEKAEVRAAVRSLRTPYRGDVAAMGWVAPLLRRLPLEGRRRRVNPAQLHRRHRATGARCVSRLAPASAYRHIIAWESRYQWLFLVDLLSETRTDTLVRHRISRDNLLLWASTISLYAEPRTGRRCIVAVKTLKELTQRSKSVLDRARRCLEEWGLYETIVEGRHLTFEECRIAREQGSPQTGLTREVALTVPRDLWTTWHQNRPGYPQGKGGMTCKDTPTRGRGPASENCAEPSGVPRRARTKAAPSSPQHQRSGAGPSGEGAVEPQKAALRGLTARLARELIRTLPWLDGEQPGRLRPILSRFASGPLPWTANDVATYLTLRDARLARPSITADRIHTRPAAVLAAALRDADPQADHPRGDQLLDPTTPPLPAQTVRPAWCGACDERTRHVELPDGRVARCAVCHPLTGVRPV